MLLAAAVAGGLVWLISFSLDYRARAGPLHRDRARGRADLAAGPAGRAAATAGAAAGRRTTRGDDGLLLLDLAGEPAVLGLGPTGTGSASGSGPSWWTWPPTCSGPGAGSTRARSPNMPASILGDPLWQLMTRSPTRSPSRAELSRLVEALERI